MELGQGVDFLRQQLATREAEVTQKNAEIMQLRQAIAILEGSSPDDLPRIRSTEYEDLGITAAAKKFLKEAGEPKDTRAITDALIARGWKTDAKNVIATVYATLNNGKAWFKRTSDGKWDLREKKD